MATGRPVPIPFPTSTAPGANPQESAGRLVNCHAEPIGEDGKAVKWIRGAGLSQFAATAYSGYRGGLIVGSLSYETWANEAATVNGSGSVSSIGAFPGTNKISIARNQASPTADVVAVDIDNGAYVLGSATVAAATITATFSGSALNIGDVLVIDILNEYLDNFPVSLSHTIVSSDTLTTIAAAFATLIGANSVLSNANVAATSAGAVLTITHQGAIGNSTSVLFALTAIGNVGYATTISGTQTGTGNETVTLAPIGGALVATGGALTATLTASIGGSTFTSGDVVSLTFTNANVSTLPVTVSHTLGAGESATTVAAALKTAINANTTLAAIAITATVTSGVVTISQTIGTEAVVFNPASGNLAGGTGTYGAFTGSPTAFNGQGNLPAVNSVCFQDGYFFFSTGKNKMYATGLNGLTVNPLTYVTVQAKADVNLSRVIAFSGLLLAFTTGSCEVWQDAAIAAPNFPYARIAILEVGLAQANAIDGWETGFSQLLWVAQDNGVYYLPPSTLSLPTKVSPPDLDRLIEAAIRAGKTLEASCYASQGKKFWSISSPDWTWELNLSTKKWSERVSLNAGQFGRWRATGGHPAFGKWLAGDEQTGNLLYLDDTNPSENGATQLWRMESGPVSAFPEQLRVSRADFNFVFGVGQAVGNLTMTVAGAAAGAGGAVVLAVNTTAQVSSNDVCAVSGIVGTVEANGNWIVTVIDATHLSLLGSSFSNAYTSGGTAVDLTVANNVTNPQVAISISKDGGVTWSNPLVRALGQQQKTRRTRSYVMGMGVASALGDRWRIDITDPVYVSFMGATQSSDPRYVGA